MDGKQLTQLEGHTSYVQCLAVLTEAHIARVARDRSIIVWSLADGTRLSTLQPHQRVLASPCFADGRLASGSGDSSIHVFQPDSAQLGEGHTGSGA